MRWLVRFIAIGTLAVAPLAARAENEGQPDLDRAVDVRVNASSLEDLNQIAELCKSAIEKGLDDDNRQFAEQVMTGALLQRATLLAEAFQQSDLSQRSGQQRAAALLHQALKDAEQVLQFDNEQPQAHLIIARLENIPGGNRERAKKAVDEAIRLTADDAPLRSQALTLRAGLVDSAEEQLKDLNEAVELQPESAFAVRARGLYYFQHDKREEGLTDLKRALELEPSDASTHELMAAVLADSGRIDEALESIDKAMEGGANGPELHLLRARLHIGQQNFDEAIGDLDRVLEQRPDFVPAMRIRAAVLIESGRETEAILDLEAARQRAGNDPELLMQLGLLYGATDHLGKAIDCLDQAVAAESDNYTLRIARADLLLAVGRQADALSDYAEAYRVKADDSGLLNNYAWLLATSPEDKLRDGKRSVELATEACKLTDYKQAHILSTLAAGYAEQGDFDKAIEWSTKAVELGQGEMKQHLEQELASYKEHKPWREKQEKPLIPAAIPKEQPEAAPEAEPAPEAEAKDDVEPNDG